MKLCPNCKAELDDNARFCLRCMTSLDEKEQIPPPVLRVRRWPLVLLCFLLLSALLVCVAFLRTPVPEESETAPQLDITEEPADPSQSDITQETSTLTQEIGGVRYTFRPATAEDHPTAIFLDNHFVLIRVEGTPSDGVYRVPSFLGEDTTALVTVIADGAFAGTGAQVIDLGYTIRYVWGNAFGGYALTDLYLHEDVLIDQAAFSGCTKDLTIHCPGYLENTQGVLWSDLSIEYGFRWQQENI